MDVEQQRRKAAIDTSKLMTTKPMEENDEKMGLKAERRIEKAKRRILSSRMIKELRQEMEDRPEEVRGDEPETTIFGEVYRGKLLKFHVNFLHYSIFQFVKTG